jgi:hypothetical protein
LICGLAFNEVGIGAMSKTAPLRKIVKRISFSNSPYEKEKVLLECGHEVYVSNGATHKGRCHKCEKETKTSTV